MPKNEKKCPHCLTGWGKYRKGWDMTKKQQIKGGKRGETEITGKVRISLYKCNSCMKLFRKGDFIPAKV